MSPVCGFRREKRNNNELGQRFWRPVKRWAVHSHSRTARWVPAPTVFSRPGSGPHPDLLSDCQLVQLRDFRFIFPIPFTNVTIRNWHRAKMLIDDTLPTW